MPAGEKVGSLPTGFTEQNCWANRVVHDAHFRVIVFSFNEAWAVRFDSANRMADIVVQGDLRNCLHPEDRNELLTIVKEVLVTKRRSPQIAVRFLTSAGYRKVRVQVCLLTGAWEGEEDSLALYIEELEGKSTEIVLGTIRDGGECMLILSRGYEILRVNPSVERTTGFKSAELVGRSLESLLVRPENAGVLSAIQGRLETTGEWAGKLSSRRKDGEEFPVWMTVERIGKDGPQSVGYIAQFSEIGALGSTENRLYHLEYLDSVTGLPNRKSFSIHLAEALNRKRLRPLWGAIIKIDLDHFRSINDVFGFSTGDQVLSGTASLIARCLRDADIVARLSADEFGVILTGLATNEDDAHRRVEIVSEKLIAALRTSLPTDAGELTVRASLGIALFEENADIKEEVIKRADLALYQAKEAGRDTVRFFSPAMRSAMEARSEMESAIRRALDRHEFELYYQPQVDEARRTLGYEALIRWNHPDKGVLAPGAFISVAEETGMIVPLGNWVIGEACRQLAVWQLYTQNRDMTISVNVSARQFRHADFVADVMRCVEAAGVVPGRLQLEITESVLLENLDEVASRMRALKEVGIKFALDDFGTGYSSLVYLKRLPIDEVKIDRNFVSELTRDSNDDAIVKAIIAISKSLNLGVVAEGVERSEQLQFLLENGCKRFQGFLFGRPKSIRVPAL